MTPALPVLLALVAAPTPELPTEVWQVAPDRRYARWLPAERVKDRAVLVIPGLKIHPLKPSNAAKPDLREWAEPGTELVRALGKDSDVFVFGYAQTVALDDVATSAGFKAAIADIKKAGYKEIVLLGHSAGGVIARLFAEANPDAGVTKVISVAAPHAGAGAANIPVGYPKVQAPFVQSLSKDARAMAPAQKLDDKIEMACVVCKLKRIDADGLINTASQWPEECRKCGYPAALVTVNHWEAMQTAASVKVISELVREKVARWGPAEVEQARKVLYGDK